MITLFRNTGLRHLRLGATGSASSGTRNLSHEDIDSLFAFARAADIKVLYSLHFLEGVPTAKYVMDHYRPYLDCFAFDNEPDGRLNEGGSGAAARGGQNYFVSWREFARSVVAAVPGAKFAGPDASGRTLVKRFVEAQKDSGMLALVTQHCYVGGNPRKKGIDLPQAVNNMLSRDWVTNQYPALYRAVFRPVANQGLPWRLTEYDDHVRGVTNASDAFVAALWALDALHWWAAHGAAGVNFQNTAWLRTDTFYRDAAGSYQVYPKAYGIRAFDLGSHGRVAPVSIRNEPCLNLTAYAVRDENHLYVTVINKEHGPGARAAAVTILLEGFAPGSAAAMYLTAPNGDVQATQGVRLGGATITNNAAWRGEWTAMPLNAQSPCALTVPAASAGVVKLSAK